MSKKVSTFFATYFVTKESFFTLVKFCKYDSVGTSVFFALKKN